MKWLKAVKGTLFLGLITNLFLPSCVIDPMGGLEHPCFKISLNMRIFQREIILLVLKSSGSPVFLSEELKR